MKKRGMAALLVILFMFAVIAVYVWFSYARIKPDEGRLCDGIRVDAVDVGGMTEDEAKQAVNTYIAGLENRAVQIDVNGQPVESTVGELGFSFSAGNFIEEAIKIGRAGNLIENYQQIKKASQGEITYAVASALDEPVLKKFVKKKCSKLCTSAKNAGVKMENGEFVYTDSRDGIGIDTEETILMIKDAVENAAADADIQVTANVHTEQAQVTKEVAAKCKDKIGTFSTSFNASNANRTKNLTNAARLINGSVLYPGETFSVHDAISPLTEENGYYAAASYNNGKVEDSLGGGVCQVSTTLYNAVLRAELEIAERSPHSMVVSYVEPSMDAAIAGDYKDFKFTNNSEVPVYIQGGTYSGTIYFNIYGSETRSSNRQVSFQSEVTETIEPGKDKITYDKTKPESFTEVTQEAHTGYKAILWKIVTENGKETKTQVNSSTYSASPRYVTKGSKKEELETPKPSATKKPSSDNAAKKNTDNGGQNGDNSETTGTTGGTDEGIAATPTPDAAGQGQP